MLISAPKLSSANRTKSNEDKSAKGHWKSRYSRTWYCIFCIIALLILSTSLWSHLILVWRKQVHISWFVSAKNYWNRFCYFWVYSREDHDHWIAVFIIYFGEILQMKTSSLLLYTLAVKIVEILDLPFQGNKARHWTFSLIIMFLGATEYPSCLLLSVAYMLPVCYVRGWPLISEDQRQLMKELAIKKHSTSRCLHNPTLLAD